VASLLATNIQSAAAAASLISDLEITSKMVAAEKGSAAAGKTPFTLTIQTKIKNNNSSSVMTYDSLESAVWLTGGAGGAFVTPASAGTVSASVTPTSGSVTGTDVLSPTSTTSRSFVFPNAQVTSIPANSYVQVQFDVTVTFTTGSAGTVNLLGTVNSGGSGYVGGLQSNQDSDLSSLSGLTIVVSNNGGVTASFGTASLLGYACGDNTSGFTTTCFVNNTYYGKPYVTFTATARAAGYEFVGWGGDCSIAGTSSTCTLRVTGDPSVTANFLPYPTITSALPSSEYFANNITISGTMLNSADGWAIYYAGAAGVTDDLIYESTSFVSKNTTSAIVQLPTRVQIGTYSTTYFGGSARTASSGLTWIIYPYADRTTYKTYGGTAANLTINSIGVPDAPTIGVATSTSSSSATVTFTAPASNGGATITGYTATTSPGGFTGTLASATAGTITVTGLSASTAYTFTVTATNSEGTSTASSASNSITTSAASGGTGGGGTTTSTTAADELRRQQEAAAAAKQKQDQELREILSLVPTIAGLAQGIAGLGNSLLLPQKCVKGKTVKKIKAGAKCPKGYKARK
jgi:uncharacterized repeat protein (TIGR02543 family)